MPREQVHYAGALLDLPRRSLPGGGWLEWDVTWRGPDGTRHPITALSVAADDAVAVATHQGGRAWRIAITPTARPVGAHRLQGRREKRGTWVVMAYGNADGDLVPVARQEVMM